MPSSTKFYESNAGDGTKAFDQYVHGRQLYGVFISCCLLMFLIGLDQTIIMPILETVGTRFSAYEKLSWIASGYMLSMSVFAATWGNISIITGRKWSCSAAVILFWVGSLICALANGVGMLIGGRVISGVGAGGIQTLVSIIITEMVPIHRRPVMYIGLTIAFSFASTFGPLIGGGLTENVSWRWCFYINLPIAGLALVALLILFNPPSPKFTLREKLRRFDYLGSVLLTAVCVLPLLAVTLGGVEYPWNSGAVISIFVIGGVCALCFCLWNFRYSSSPIIPPVVVKTLGVDFPAFSLFFCFFTFMGCFYYLSVYFQMIKGASPINTGVRFLPAILGVVFSTIIATILLKKTRHVKYITMFGALLSAIGAGCLSTLKLDSGSSATIGLLILPGAGFGAVAQMGTIAAQLHAPKKDGSTILSTALVHFFRSLGGALGTALCQAAFNATYKDEIRKLVKSGVLEMSASDALSLVSQPEGLGSLNGGDTELVLQTVLKGCHNAFYLCAATGTMCFVCACFYNAKRIPKAEDVQTNEDDIEVVESGATLAGKEEAKETVEKSVTNEEIV